MARTLLTSPMRRVAKNSGWALAASAVGAVALFAETILLARHLSAERLGVYLLVLVYPEAVQELLDFRVRDAMTRYLGGFLAQERKAEVVAMVKLLWLVDVAVSAVALVIVLLSAGLVAGLLVEDPAAPSLMRIYAVGLFLSSLDTASGPILRVLDRFALSFVAGSLKYIFRVGAVATVVLSEGTIDEIVWARVAGEVAATLLLGTLSLWALAPHVRGHWKARPSLLRAQQREVRSFLLHTNLTGVLRMAAVKLDKMIIGAVATPVTVSLYKIASQFGSVPLMVSDALDTVIYPTFARLFPTERRSEIREIASRISLVLAVLSLPAGIIIALNATALAELIGGDDFAAAGTPLVLVLAGILPYTVLLWQRALILTAGHARAQVRILTVSTVVQLAALAILTPLFGATGAGASLGLRYVAVTIQQAVFVQRQKLLA